MISSTKSIFIVDGALNRPILHSQGIPLIKKLAEKGHQCWILSFECNNGSSQNSLQTDLEQYGIKWKSINPTSSIICLQRSDFITKGFVKAYQLCRQEAIDVIHCRSYRPAVIGNILKKILGCGFLFDMRGFLIDEQIMLGRWQSKGVRYWLARRLEKSCLLNADIIVANTNAFKETIKGFPYFPSNTDERIAIIPNCVDTQRFKPDSSLRVSIREELGWNNRFVMVFTGEYRTWESFSYIIEWFSCLKSREPKALIAFYVYGDLKTLDGILKAKLAYDDYFIRTIPTEKIPAYLNAADIGVLFRVSNPYTRAIPSPIKFGEYLSCGLPVITNGGIGDTDQIIARYDVGAIVNFNHSEQVSESVNKMLYLVKDDANVHKRCRAAAEAELSLEFAVGMYENLYNKISSKVRQIRK